MTYVAGVKRISAFHVIAGGHSPSLAVQLQLHPSEVWRCDVVFHCPGF